MLKAKKHLNVGFPIAEVDHKGECVITKEENTGGIITVGSVTSQLLYEIQGPLYMGSDVVAELSNIKMEQVGEDRVKVTGVKGHPPPPTTKIGYVFLPSSWCCANKLENHGSCWISSRVSYLLGRSGHRGESQVDRRPDQGINWRGTHQKVLAVKISHQWVLTDRCTKPRRCHCGFSRFRAVTRPRFASHG